MNDKDISDRVELESLKTLSDDHYILRRADFRFRHRDGHWRHQARESYDIGDGASVLPVDAARGTVILVRQFRWPVYEAGYREGLIETIAGKLDGDTPHDCATREALEEAGVAITDLSLVTQCFMSPGAVKEQVWLFLASYDGGALHQKGGGLAEEGEDIEVLEIALDEGLAMIASGQIIDAKTILLLQAAKLKTYSPPG
jgi:nudix-type nucleoside diphosphatase (YffH/AdpP family)